MDTVTEHEMAIALAMHGGIGVIHKNLSPEQQAKEVEKVKHHVHGLIRTPITVSPNQKVREVLQMCDEKGRRFRTFPVVEDGALCGVVTSQDFGIPISEDTKISDIMTREVLTIGKEATPEQALEMMRAHKKKVLPVVGEDGKTLVGLYLKSDVERVTGLGDKENLDDNGQLFVAGAIDVGTDQARIDRALGLVRAGANALVIDTAHGDTAVAISTILKLRSELGGAKVDIVVGNISEPESAWRLARAGADAIKVGQGPGSICTTRKVAGIGNPQVTAIYACSRAIRDFEGVTVIADGGITASGDIVVALATGANCVMIGRAFAGCDESPGGEQVVQGVRYKKYRGMGSLAAMNSNRESRSRYGQGDVPTGKLVAEGVEALIPATGSVAGELNKMVGGLRAGMGYTGSPTIAKLRENARFRRLTPGAVGESSHHSLAHVVG
jgi:IMP dehydrogenase